MPLVGSDLANQIRGDMGFPTPTSSQLIGWGGAVVQHIQTGIVEHASGDVTGTVPASGGPLSNGAATNGVISGLSGSGLASLVSAQAGYPGVSPQLQSYCEEIVNHIQNVGLVEFDPGNITGICTNTITPGGPVPGTLTAGAGIDGVITSLNGPQLADNIHSAVGYPGSTSGPLIQFCTALTTYIMDNAQVEYASGSVTGTCPAGGGSLQNGAGLGGIIS